MHLSTLIRQNRNAEKFAIAALENQSATSQNLEMILTAPKKVISSHLTKATRRTDEAGIKWAEMLRAALAAKLTAFRA